MVATDTDNERELVRQSRHGNPEAFAALIRAHQQMIHALTYRMAQGSRIALRVPGSCLGAVAGVARRYNANGVRRQGPAHRSHRAKPRRQAAEANVCARVCQTTSANAAPLPERPWKPLTVLPGQTVLETAALDFPAVRVETSFLVQWLDGANAVLGKTEVRVFPTNLLARLQTLAGDSPLGVFDPADQLKPLLRPLAAEFQDLAEDGTDKFTGKLAVFGPFAPKSQMRASLTSDIRALAKRGAAVVWLQPPPAPRDSLRPSFHTVRVGGGRCGGRAPSELRGAPGREPGSAVDPAPARRIGPAPRFIRFA